MAAHGSTKVVLVALMGNFLIAVTKFSAAFFTSSSAMFSEAVHSLVDTSNQALLLYGMKRSTRKSDIRHPFGYGREIYFWAFVVALLIFAAGASVSLYEGWHKLQHPEPVQHAYVNYIVLGLSLLFEGGAWWVAFKEFRKEIGDKKILQAVRDSKDPTVFTVLFEDTAAVLGLLIALVGVYAGDVMGVMWADGVASMVIGVILAITAFFLTFECKGLLIGEGASPAVVKIIRELSEKANGVTWVNDVLTIHKGPKDILVNISLDFEDGMVAREIEATIAALHHNIRQVIPEVRRVFIEVQSHADYGKGEVL
jgi:cation diffusion facilitator family transporter